MLAKMAFTTQTGLAVLIILQVVGNGQYKETYLHLLSLSAKNSFV